MSLEEAGRDLHKWAAECWEATEPDPVSPLPEEEEPQQTTFILKVSQELFDYIWQSLHRKLAHEEELIQGLKETLFEERRLRGIEGDVFYYRPKNQLYKMTNRKWRKFKPNPEEPGEGLAV